jgi:hypothetical protein
MGKPVGQHQEEEELGVRRTLSFVVEIVRQQGLELPADRFEAADLAVVHEAPAPRHEGMAVRPARAAAGCRPHMCQEQAGTDLTTQALQVGV